MLTHEIIDKNEFQLKNLSPFKILMRNASDTSSTREKPLCWKEFINQ